MAGPHPPNPTVSADGSPQLLRFDLAVRIRGIVDMFKPQIRETASPDMDTQALDYRVGDPVRVAAMDPGCAGKR